MAAATRIVCLAGSLGAAMLAGCTVGPNYHKPSVPTAPAYSEVRQDNSGPVPAQIGAPDWWKAFNDPVLDGLEQQALTANQDIKIAVANVDQANAVLRSVHASQLPYVGANPSVSRTREAQQSGPANSTGKANTYNDLLLPLTFSYEIDAWGRIRRMVESAHASAQASEADLRFARLSIEASVGIDYYSLRETDAELRVLTDNETQFQNAYDILKHRFDGGIAGELDLRQAETLLEQVRAQIEACRMRRDQTEHAIAVLLGRTAEGFHVEQQTAAMTPPVIPAGIPSELLERRPDIIAAERTIAATNAQIGVAKAAYFPQLSLTGVAGYESTSAGSLFSWENAIASLGASAVAPIFTGGRLKAGVDQARASYQSSLAQYEKTVLTAYQEVEDQLAAVHYLRNQGQADGAAVSSAGRAEEIAMNRYKAGLVGYLDVVYAQQTLLNNEQAETQVNGQQMIATVVLIKALGGGWSENKIP